MNRPTLSLLALSISLLILPLSNPKAQEALNTQEQTALLQVHQINQLEMHLAQMVLDKVESKIVHNLAQRIYRDHQFADDKFAELARDFEIRFEELSPEVQEMAATEQVQSLYMIIVILGYATPIQLQQIYPMIVVSSHRMAQELLAQASEVEFTSRELEELIFKLIPILRQHEQLGLHVEKEMGINL